MKSSVMFATELLIVVATLAGMFVMIRSTRGGESITAVDVPNNAALTSAVAYVNKTMKLTSTSFTDKSSIPAQYTCDGSGVMPALTFSGVPTNAQSLALFVEDPDVPTTIRNDGLWVHLIAWNIPADSPGVEAAGKVNGTYGANTGGKNEYQGPCPPDGTHRYFFRLFALDTKIDLPEGSTQRELLAAMRGHVVAESELMGTYTRGAK